MQVNLLRGVREIRHKLQKLCKKMHEKQNTQGFTLVELIVVLTILTILAVMLIPTLQGYLEKTLETADVAEVRQAYMDVLTASLTGDSENMTQTVKLHQKEDDWQSMDPVTIAGITHSKADGDTANWIGIPTAGGRCEVSYKEGVGIVFTWSGKNNKPSLAPRPPTPTINFDEDIHGILKETGLLDENITRGFEIDSKCPNSKMLPEVQNKLSENSLLKYGTWAYLADTIQPGNHAYLFWTSVDTNAVGANTKIPVIVSRVGGGYYIAESVTAARTAKNPSQSYVAIAGHISNYNGFSTYTQGTRYDTMEEAYAVYKQKLETDYKQYEDTLPK